MMVFVFGISVDVSGQENEASEPTLEDMSVPMGIIVLEPDESVEQKRTPVEFHHSKHFTFDCKKCHHKWEGKTHVTFDCKKCHHKWEGKTHVPTCRTTDCHDSFEPPKKPTKFLSYTETGIKYYKYAYHQMCVGCHKEIKIKRKAMEMSYTVLKDKLPKTGPTGCVECHPKE
jgi:hypothetical protein